MTIDILFVGGSFGTTLEYVLRTFSDQFQKIPGHIDAVGSLHPMRKEFHPLSADHLKQLATKKYEISTPVYPNFDCSPATVIDLYKKYARQENHTVIVTIPDWQAFVINQIMIFNKNPETMYPFVDNPDNLKRWNTDIKRLSDMRRWQRREYLSFVHSQQWDNLQNITTESSWLELSNTEILFNFEKSVHVLFKHCNLDMSSASEFASFAKHWYEKQKGWIQLSESVKQIIGSLMNNTYITWRPLDEIQESLLQAGLRRQGVEMLCQDLDELPCDSRSLSQHLQWHI